MTDKRSDIEAELADEVKILVPLQEQMNELAQKPEVVKYLEATKQFRDTEKAIRLTIQTQMENNNIKKISGDWGYMTIVERANYRATDINDVPSKFVKKALDTTKVAAQLKLTGELPRGVETNPTRSLTIKLKSPTEAE